MIQVLRSSLLTHIQSLEMLLHDQLGEIAYNKTSTCRGERFPQLHNLFFFCYDKETYFIVAILSRWRVVCSELKVIISTSFIQEMSPHPARYSKFKAVKMVNIQA